MSKSTFRPPALLSVVVLILAGVAAHAQDQGDKYDFSNIPADEQSTPYIGVGGGYLGMLTFMNYDALNKVSGSLGLGEFSGPLLYNGGGGFTAIYILKQLRLGV